MPDEKIRDRLKFTLSAEEVKNISKIGSKYSLLESKSFQDWAGSIGLSHSVARRSQKQIHLAELFVGSIFLGATDPVRNDNSYNNTIRSKKSKVFHEMSQIISKAKSHNPETTKNIIEFFLNLIPIKNLQNDFELTNEHFLFEIEFQKLQKKYPNVDASQYDQILQEIDEILDNVIESSNSVKDNPQQIKKYCVAVQNAIKNASEDLRYIVGFLISMLDILENSVKDNIENYFNKENSAIKMYKHGIFHPKNKLRSLLTKYSKENTESIRDLFENVFFKNIHTERLSQAHWESEVKQDKLESRIWKIQGKKSVIEVSPEQLKQDFLKIYRFLILSKGTIAGHYFSGDWDKIEYLMKT
jgi:hypothetical protein